MKDPAFLFYPSDFLTGVTDLTMEERGQYITLLCLQHQKGVLSEKTIRLSLGNVSVDVLSKFSKDEQGNYFNERLKIEIEKRSAFVDSRRENGSKGGRPKKPNGYPNDYPSDKPNEEPTNNLPINRNINENKDLNNFVLSIQQTEVLKMKYKSLQTIPMEDLLEAFRFHLVGQSVVHTTQSEFSSHLFNWIEKPVGQKVLADLQTKHKAEVLPSNWENMNTQQRRLWRENQQNKLTNKK